jgi:hypothetical protein
MRNKKSIETNMIAVYTYVYLASLNAALRRKRLVPNGKCCDLEASAYQFEIMDQLACVRLFFYGQGEQFRFDVIVGYQDINCQ